MRQLWTNIGASRLSRLSTIGASWLTLCTILLLSPAPLQADDLAEELHERLTPFLLPGDGAASRQVSNIDLAYLYAARDFQPIWQDEERRQRLQQAINSLQGDGLNPARYSVVQVNPGRWQLCDELRTTIHYLQALLHLQLGVLDRETIEPLWRHQPVDLQSRRKALLYQAQHQLDDPVAAFEQARPAAPSYAALRQAFLALLTTSEEPPWPAISSGSLLRPGMLDPRVGELRRRLIASGYLAEQKTVADYYDDALLSATLAFQRGHSLAEDGVVGAATLTELNKSRRARLDQLRANLERWRWRTVDWEPHLVVVDIAGARLQYYRDDTLQWQSRTQVGTAGRRTPDLKSLITHFTFNPSWTIPPTILRQDKLPQIRANPEYLSQNQLQVLDTDGNPLDPDQIDWDRPGAIMLRQQPGPYNPLGRVAIRFPNPFAVYLHDTPSQRLFASAQRTFSSGCVRVEGAMSLVDQFIAVASDYRPDYIDQVVASGRTGNIRLTTPIPLLMDYWTADLGEDGHVVLRPDIYRRDDKLAAALQRSNPHPQLEESCLYVSNPDIGTLRGPAANSTDGLQRHHSATGDP